MNKNRARTQRRLKARQALSSRYRDLDGVSYPRHRAPVSERRSIQSQNADRTPVSLALDFEVQTKDKSGRWRKLAGEPRVHTFGLARLRAQKVLRTNRVAVRDMVRVRSAVTGDVWSV